MDEILANLITLRKMETKSDFKSNQVLYLKDDIA